MRYVLALALVGLVAFGLWRGSGAQVVVAAGSPSAKAEAKKRGGRAGADRARGQCAAAPRTTDSGF